MTGLLHNEDCTDFFYTQDFPPGRAGEIVDRYVDVIAGAGVTVLFCNTNARRTNYRSAVWEAFWDGYDPDGPDDQPFLAAIPAAQRVRWRKLVHNMLDVHRQNVDYPARVIERCRHQGISPWISLRMNDAHCNDNLDHPFHGAIWRRLEYFRKGHPGYYARCLDYAHADVRNLYRALVAETLERYDVDGIELDFMREPYLFSAGQEQKGREILSEWLREIRRLVDAASQKHSRTIKIGVRVPSDPGVAMALGLDAPEWAREHLVDLVVPTPRWRTMQFDIPLARWRELLGPRVTLAGGLESRCQPSVGGPVDNLDPDYDAGAAVAVLSGGADAVYLFNHFQNSGRWSIPEYQRRLRSMRSLDSLNRQPRRHAVTHREIVVPGEDYRPPLPATGKGLSFRLPLGPVPPDGWRAEVRVEVQGRRPSHPPPQVSVNSVACQLAGEEPDNKGKRWANYTIPSEALPGENRDVIDITATGDRSVTVCRVEVRFAPAVAP